MALDKKTPSDAATPATTLRQEVTAAMQFWQTIEYLSPQKPPKSEMTTCDFLAVRGQRDHAGHKEWGAVFGEWPACHWQNDYVQGHLDWHCDPKC